MKGLAELAERPTPHTKWQGQSLCFNSSANLLTLWLYKLLALRFTLHYFTGQNKNCVMKNMVSPPLTTMWHPRPQPNIHCSDNLAAQQQADCSAADNFPSVQIFISTAQKNFLTEVINSKCQRNRAVPVLKDHNVRSNYCQWTSTMVKAKMKCRQSARVGVWPNLTTALGTSECKAPHPGCLTPPFLLKKSPH